MAAGSPASTDDRPRSRPARDWLPRGHQPVVRDREPDQPAQARSRRGAHQAGERRGDQPDHLALAFVLQHPAVTSAIIGPRTMQQLEDQLGAAATCSAPTCSTASTARALPGPTWTRAERVLLRARDPARQAQETLVSGRHPAPSLLVSPSAKAHARHENGAGSGSATCTATQCSAARSTVKSPSPRSSRTTSHPGLAGAARRPSPRGGDGDRQAPSPGAQRVARRARRPVRAGARFDQRHDRRTRRHRVRRRHGRAPLGGRQ